MGAFTTFDQARLERHLYMYALGDLVSWAPIATGIENSNYRLRLSGDDGEQEYVLTILEDLGFDEVPFFNTLMTHLANKGLPVAAPVPTLDGMTSTIFCGKPTLLFPRLAGSHPQTADAGACHGIGQALAEMHQAAGSMALPPEKRRANPWNLDWARAALAEAARGLAGDDRALLEHCLAIHQRVIEGQAASLPKGIIHGDLFRDNTLFAGDRLTGILDFYHACEDFLIQDLAITLNDWCSTGTGEIDQTLAAEMIRGYESVRPLSDEECAALPDFQKIGAMRFVLTRLQSGEEGGHLKDPEEFLKIARRLDTAG